jgi:preprotein translocase subunit SecE
MATAKAKSELGFFERAKRFLRDYFVSLRVEWGKLTFPTRKELVQSTIVVFLFTMLLMAIISAYDALMSVLFNRILLPPSIT